MKRVRVPIRIAPSFAHVQALRAKCKQELPPLVRKYLGENAESTLRTSALRKLSEKFAAAMRRKGWLAEEGYAK